METDGTRCPTLPSALRAGIRFSDCIATLLFPGLLQFLDPDIAKPNRPVIALEENRAGLVNLVVNLAAGRLAALDIVMNLHAVLHHGDFVADHRGLDRLPFAAGFGNEFVGRLEVIDRTVAAETGPAFGVVAEDLQFMPAAEVKAAIRIVRHL